MSAGRVIATNAALALLSGCAVKTLKAPCSRDEGPKIVPMAYSSLGAPNTAEDDACGPMKFVNPPGGEGPQSRGRGASSPAGGRDLSQELAAPRGGP